VAAQLCGIRVGQVNAMTFVITGVLGGIAGALIAVAAWRVSRETGALPETSNVDVSRYEVLVERRDANKALELLGD
jgi:ABC-type branched-subunit amino acid transport system permease subunit